MANFQEFDRFLSGCVLWFWQYTISADSVCKLCASLIDCASGCWARCNFYLGAWGLAFQVKGLEPSELGF